MTARAGERASRGAGQTASDTATTRAIQTTWAKSERRRSSAATRAASTRRNSKQDSVLDSTRRRRLSSAALIAFRRQLTLLDCRVPSLTLRPHRFPGHRRRTLFHRSWLAKDSARASVSTTTSAAVHSPRLQLIHCSSSPPRTLAELAWSSPNQDEPDRSATPVVMGQRDRMC